MKIEGLDAQVGNFLYVTRKPDATLKWIKMSRFPFNTWIIPPNHDRVGLGALDLMGWQFFLCSDDEIQEAVTRGLPVYLDSRMRIWRP